MHNLEFDKSGKMIGWVDDIGGRHKNGEGWNPFGFYCGECASDTCEFCPIVTNRMPWETTKKGE